MRALGRWASAGVFLGLTIAVLIGLFTFTLGAVAIAAFEKSPRLPDPGVDVSAIEDLGAAVNRNTSRASVIVDAAGGVIGRFAPEETHLPLEVGAVPPVVETALLAAEDAGFREHGGFEPEAIARALLKNLSSGDIRQGGSTITQQLAKNLFTGDDDSLDRKLQELQVAIDLEARFSKDEILAAYVNSVFLGNGAFGFEAAARTYFDKPASEMTLSEAALLVGVLPAPTARDPRADFAAADRARRSVLARVRATGLADDEEVDRALAEVPQIQPRRPTTERFPYYLDYVRRYLLDEQQIDPSLLYGGGLRIETAVDPRLQEAAQAAVAAHLPSEFAPEAALAVVDVQTGLVKAIVGGRDFEASAVNLALGSDGGGAGRQAGSSFKPFVLATAFESGIVPDQVVPAPAEYLPVTVDDPKPVQNFDKRGRGSVTLTAATIASINTTFVALTEFLGSAAVRDTATSLGIDGLPESPGPSIGIGAYETSPLDMAGAYAGFADDGRRVITSPVTRVIGSDGEVVEDFTPVVAADRQPAISPQSARLINRILEANLQRGTATRAQFGRPAAAKTGTTDEYSNAWLAGHTPQFATAVWVGDPAGNVPMRDIAGFSTVTGGSIPALIWRDVMAAAHDGLPVVDFAAPAPTPPPTKSVTSTSRTKRRTGERVTSTTSSSTTTRPTTTRPSTTLPPPTTRPPTTTTTRPTTTTTTTTTTAPPPTTTPTTTAPPSTTSSSTTTTTSAPPD